jgi:hypothetical protein
MLSAAFAVICMFCIPFSSLAGVGIPIPMYYGGGSSTKNDAIGLLVAFNIPLILIYVIRSIIWIVKYNKWEDYKKCSYFEYVIFSDTYNTPLFTSITFGVINGIAILVWIAELVSNAL